MEQTSGNKKILKFFIKLSLILIFIFYTYATIQRVWFKEDKNFKKERDKNVKQENCLELKNYIGECKDGKKHGKGTLTLPNLEGYKEYVHKYVGEFKNDEYHGHGTLFIPNGAIYVGEFENGRFHGKGTYIFPDGKKLIGEFKDNEFVR
jgi:hypothetical protein